MVLGDHGPAVRHLAGVALAGVDHGLDRESHAFFKPHALARTAVVQHLRFIVVDAADAVPAVFAYHGITGRFRVLLDRMADVAQRRAGLDLPDAQHHRLISGVDQPFGQHRRLAHEIHARSVAVPAVLDHGDVAVDDVAFLQDLAGAGNAVANHVVDRRAQRLGEPTVAHVGRNRTLHVDDVVVGDLVDLLGGDAGLDVVLQHGQHFGREPTGHTQACIHRDAPAPGSLE